MTTVACVGIATLDIVFDVAQLPGAPGKYRAHQRVEVGGGVAANAAATVSALGGHARFFGVVGDDDTGDRIVSGLDTAAVDTSGVRRNPGRRSPLSAVLVDDAGERLIVNHASPDLFTSARAVTPEELGDVDVILTDMRWRDGAIAALRAAAADGRPGIVDCDHNPNDAPGVIEAASHVVFSLPTLTTFTGYTEPKQALRDVAERTGAWVATTAGADGVYWLENGELRHLPAPKVQVVDTLGAGDVFHGAFALALAEGKTLEEALRWAGAAAALKCTRFGGRSGIPRRDEVEAFLENTTWS